MSQSPAEVVSADVVHPTRGYQKALAALGAMLREGGSFSGRERKRCFLNTGGARFADMSAVSGLDRDDDGRALAVTDWDFDGRLDLWMSCRTAPQIRLLHNELPTDNRWLAVKLEGRTCNRDAIGARLELFVRGGVPGRKFIKTLRAGDGFLSQSSKWVHFGLGQADEIERLVVRWPGGKAEEFRNFKPNRRFRLVQDSGIAEPWSAPVASPAATVVLQPPEPKPPAVCDTARIVHVHGRVPVPDVSFTDRDGRTVPLADRLGRGWLLINIWASWCPGCREELTRFTRSQERLRAAGADVLALNVDALDRSPRPDTAGAEAVLRESGFPFASGAATDGLMEALDILQRTYLDRKRELPLPCSFLIDPAGLVAATYKGPVDVERLLEDVRTLGEPAGLRDRAVPFAGRWLTPRPQVDPIRMAEEFLEAGRFQDAERYYRKVLPLYAGATAESLLPKGRVDGGGAAEGRAPRSAKLVVVLAMLIAAVGGVVWLALARLWPANVRLRLAASLGLPGLLAAYVFAAPQTDETAPQDPVRTGPPATVPAAPDIRSPRLAGYHYLAATILLDQGKTEPAIAALRETLRFEPNLWSARLDLADALVGRGADEEGAAHFEAALRINADDPETLNALGAALLRQGRAGDAAGRFRDAVRLQPDYTAARCNLGTALQAAGKPAEAAAEFREAVRRRPDRPEGAVRLAWILATHPDAAVRNGREAVELAEAACRTAGGRTDAAAWDALAAAHAENGRFREAASAAKRAAGFAEAAGQSALTAEIRSRLAGYEAGKPWRSPR